jgi:probable HAF family extracellular repeat protein
VRDSVPLAINNSGQVLAADLTGSVTGTRGDSFVYSNGQTTAIPSYASVLNDQGQVAGYTGNGAAATPSNPFDPRAYLYNVAAKTVQYLTATGTLPTEPLAINSAGQVAGILYPAVSSTPYVTHPFLYSDGKFVDLGTLGGKSAGALAINSQGDVVGGADTPNSQGHAFLYSKGTMKDLGTLPGGWSSFATSINNLGQVVGSSTSTEGPIGFRGSNGGFLYSNGVMQDLNELIAPGSGWDIISANQINNRGQILALGMNMDGSKYENLLLTPTGLPEPGNAVYPTIIPEPSSWIVFGLISVGLAVQQRHRRRNPASTCRQ